MSAQKLNRSSRGKKTSTGALVGGGIALLVLAYLIFGPFGLNMLGAAPVTPATTPTTYGFTVLDYAKSTAMDHDDYDINIFGVDVAGMSADEISDLLYADYSLEDTIDAGQTFAPQVDYEYMALVNGSDICSVWFEPVLGMNTIYAMNLTEDVTVLAYSTPAFTTTVNQTDAREWTIVAQTLDASESVTADETSLEGYLPYFDFATNTEMNVVIQVELNTTATLAMCAYEGPGEAEESASGVYVYYEIDSALLGSQEFNIKFASTLGTSFEVIGVSIGYGNAGSFTAWDTQN